MIQQEALDWAKGQDVVKVRAFKENEEDKFTFVVGEYVVSPLAFDSQEEVDRYRDWETDRKSTRLNSSHSAKSRMPSSA